MLMRLLFSSFTTLVLLLPTAKCKACNSSCGKLLDISYPFRLKGDPQECGKLIYELSCEDNHPILHLYSGKYYVEEINYVQSTIRVVDVGLQKNNCSSLPLHSLMPGNFSHGDPYKLPGYNSAINFLECEAPVNSTWYKETANCGKNSSSNFSLPSLQTHSYVVVGDMRALDVEDSCSIGMVVWILTFRQNVNSSLFLGIHDGMLYGTELVWHRVCYLDHAHRKHRVHCALLDPFYFLGKYASLLISLLTGFNAVLKICGIPFVFVFLIYKWRRRKVWMYSEIEDFIHNHSNLVPIRYSYSKIKKMTKDFEEKLGEGGYGSVYKGKLQSGRLVAVKMINSKANGQDFMNEVATIGRIHHVNVVQLIGFCAERSKRALVYDFMTNGSLDKHIFPQAEGNISLNFKQIYKISLGVAHGIEYLHRGCDMKIVHFDIKPHNILLDETFTPKVSDFGLAKSYPTDDSSLPVTAARGTLGYMAPELFYNSIGGVSYKADVYSFGMLLMEMASRRKNLNVLAEHSSQMYFPSWVYDQFSEEKDIEMGDATEEEQKLAKKMITVALWCIQLKPSDRPSMSNVVEMLEGNVEALKMPPKPFSNPGEAPAEDHSCNTIPTASTSATGIFTGSSL